MERAPAVNVATMVGDASGLGLSLCLPIDDIPKEIVNKEKKA